MKNKIKVSVVSISYNQENYIKQALDSFVSQKANFNFEVIIADDCSTDNTANIIKDFSKKYPDVIKPILRNKNVGIAENLMSAMRAAKGEYIALCEGDDFWTDTNKLQVQTDFLDKKKDYALCFHPVKVFFEKKEEKEYIFPDKSEFSKFDLENLVKRNFIQTNSVMYRNVYKYDTLDILPLDWYLHLYHAKLGKIGFIDKVMSSYRRHPDGVWWNSYKNTDKIWLEKGILHLGLFAKLADLYKDDENYRKIFLESFFRIMKNLNMVSQKYDKYDVIKNAAKTYPEYVLEYQLMQNKTIEEKNRRINQRDGDIEKLKHELSLIKTSKIWKLRNALAVFLGKPKV